jgi:hypothetical protein
VNASARRRVAHTLQTMRPFKWIVGVVLLGVAVALGADYRFRCLRPPLTRDEALARANVWLERYGKTFEPKGTMKLSEAIFEADTNVWLVTFKGPTCELILIVDRCHGDEAGSTTACGG